MTNLSKAST